MRPPTFSILMAAYNAATTIRPAILSALGQTRPDLELIVMDDGSTDGTAAVARSAATDSRLQVVELGRNGGQAAALNRALERAVGRYVSFLDADDLMMPHYLETMGALLGSGPTPEIAFADAWVLTDEVGRIRETSLMEAFQPVSGYPQGRDAFLLEVINSNFTVNEPTVDREAVTAVGGLDEQMGYAEDYDLIIRLLANGCEPVLSLDKLLIVRDRPNSLSKNTRLMLQGVLEVLRRITNEYEVSDEARRRARQRSRRIQLQLLPRRSVHLERALRTMRATVMARPPDERYLDPLPGELESILRQYGSLPTSPDSTALAR